MLLTIDVGNTNLTLGLYDGDQLGRHWRLATDHARMPDEYGLQFLGLLQNAGKTISDLNGISLASVVPQLTTRVVQACHEYLKQEPLIVDTGVKTGIKIRYEDPKAVGADRVCDAVAVMKLYGGPACVVDFGTATTFNAITKDGEYLGGAITAGVSKPGCGGVVHTRGKTPAHRSATPAVRDREQHRPRDAVRTHLRICKHGRRDGRSLSVRAGTRDESRGHGRAGRSCCTGD
jgi:hypothetical protein